MANIPLPNDDNAIPRADPNAGFPNVDPEQGRQTIPRPNPNASVFIPLASPQVGKATETLPVSPFQGVGLQIYTPTHAALHTARNVLVQETPLYKYQIWGKPHLPSEFNPGTIFSAPLHSPDHRPRPDTADQKVKWTAYGPVYTKLRKFVVISTHRDFCVALRLCTFNGRGMERRVNKGDYCSIRDRDLPAIPHEGFFPSLYMERNEDIKTDSGVHERNQWHMLSRNTIVDMTYSVAHAYSSYCVIEGNLLEYSPFVRERPQDQITWLKWMNSERVGANVSVLPMVDASGRPGAVVYQRLPSRYMMDEASTYYSTGGSSVVELPAGQVRLPPTAQEFATLEAARLAAQAAAKKIERLAEFPVLPKVPQWHGQNRLTHPSSRYEGRGGGYGGGYPRGGQGRGRTTITVHG